VQNPATAAGVGGSALLAGGLDTADVSTGSLTRVSGHKAITVGKLPQPLHDAAATAIDGKTYLFGGGEPSHDQILRTSPGPPAQVGSLPVPASDVSAATIGPTAYIVGGYTGTQALDSIVAWRPGTRARVVGHLPHGLRYAAVTEAGGELVIAGGTNGVNATRAVYAFDPASRKVKTIARLPKPLTHAAAATLGQTVFVMGGRGSNLGTQTDAVLAVDMDRGRVTHAGRLPGKVSDAGVVTVGDRIYLAGGRNPSGRVLADVLVLRQVHP
jgi:N-acetylneuraminic acid mutarotase